MVLFRGGYTRSSTSAEQSEAREDDRRSSEASRVASPLVMETRGRERRLGAAHSGASCVRATQATTLLLRRTVVPHETTSDSDIDCSGFAALHLRQRPTSSTRKRAKATHLGPRGFTPRGADESERERAREAQLHQPASRERSSFSRSPLRRLTLVWQTRKRARATHLGPRGFTPRGADESERKRRTRRSRPAASRERSNNPPRPPRIHSEGRRRKRANAGT